MHEGIFTKNNVYIFLMKYFADTNITFVECITAKII